MAAKGAGTSRDERLKAALRENLKRRKQATRKTQESPAETGPARPDNPKA